MIKIPSKLSHKIKVIQDNVTFIKMIQKIEKLSVNLKTESFFNIIFKEKRGFEPPIRL